MEIVVKRNSTGSLVDWMTVNGVLETVLDVVVYYLGVIKGVKGEEGRSRERGKKLFRIRRVHPEQPGECIVPWRWFLKGGCSISTFVLTG